VGVLCSIIISFIYGFKGVLSNSLENRIFAWCLLFHCGLYYLLSPFLSLAIEGQLLWVKVLYMSIFGLLFGFLQTILTYLFASWVQRKIGRLLDQKVEVYTKISSKLTRGYWAVLALTWGILLMVVVLSNIL
jgi:hypothetical protein